MQLHPVVKKGDVSEAYSADDYDYEDDDFEDDDGHEKSPVAKRIGTPHSSKKGAASELQWGDDDEKAMEDGGGLDVEGQDLESYMKHYSSSESNNATNIEDLACELKPLEGVRPKLDNVEEEKLLHKLGYSYSNNSSPVKSSGYAVRTDNSPSPSMKYYQPHHVGESWNSSKYDSAKFKLDAAKFESTLMEVTYKEENPSTRTSKDTKNSPTPTQGEKSNHKVGFSLAKNVACDDHNSSDDEGSGFTSPKKKNDTTVNGKGAANYMDNFKNLLDTQPTPQGKKGASPKSHEPSAADLILLSKKQPTPGEERENAERVDALLMELFPERYDKKTKKTKAGGGKKAAAGYNKNQAYGLAAPRAPPSVEYLYSSSAHSSKHSQMSNMHAHPQDDEDAHSPLMHSLDQQLRLLKKELKAKDDKITRLTEHAVMMGHHMDKLKGEAAHLTVQLREANLELDAKEARLQEALKQRKKAKKAAAAGYSGNGNNSSGGGNNNADSAALENENARLRDREQALMDAIEELSNQNEDLIEKLKESMERELILSSKRAAQISHTVSNITSEQPHHHQSYHHLPSITAAAGANAGLRTHSQPEQSVATGAKKATRKKRA